ncbi:MAG: FAD-binding oxidoreductase [Pseudomonadota bacterium]
MSALTGQQLIEQLKTELGDAAVLTGDDVSGRAIGWANPASRVARAILRPASTEQLALAVRRCADAGQPVVTYGGGTGLVAGTDTSPTDVLLSLERMNRIETVDASGSTMTVQAGAILQSVQERAEADGFTFALDLGARGSATVGGAIATNAGGNSVIRYGMMREQVLGLEAVLADGTVLSSMNRMLKNNAGYDLKQLFIGTEGTLGIVTRAVLRLRPAMQSACSAFLALDRFEPIPELLKHLGSESGGTLSAFEVMWRDFYEALAETGNHDLPLGREHAYYILVEWQGGDVEQDAARFESSLAAAVEAGWIADAAIAASERQRQAFWGMRDDIDGLREVLGDIVMFDVSLPISDAERYTSAVFERLRARWPEQFRGVTFGHLGDSNIHFMLTTGSDDHESHTEAMRIVYDELRPFGGSISAEHGIGTEKQPYLGVSRSEEEIAMMRRLKGAFDPANILNPGKVI